MIKHYSWEKASPRIRRKILISEAYRQRRLTRQFRVKDLLNDFGWSIIEEVYHDKNRVKMFCGVLKSGQRCISIDLPMSFRFLYNLPEDHIDLVVPGDSYEISIALSMLKPFKVARRWFLRRLRESL